MAQLDNSIYFQQENPDFIGSVQRGLTMKDMITKRNKETAVEDAYRQGYSVGPDGKVSQNRDMTMSALVKADPREAYQYEQQTKQQESANSKAQMEKSMQAVDAISRIAPTIKDQASYEAGMSQLSGLGYDVSKMPRSYDKNLVNRYSTMALSAKDQLDQKWKQMGYDLDVQKLSLEKQKVGDQKATAQKDMKQSQALAAGFGRRMEQAEKIFDDLVKNGYDRTEMSSAVGASGMYPNKIRGGYGVQQDQAERNFVNAVLRRESGAAIGKDEFESASMQYFPRAGDDAQTLANKKANRQQAIETMRAEAGSAYDRVPLVAPKREKLTSNNTDQEAVDWANQNKADPRAIQILKLNGLGG